MAQTAGAIQGTCDERFEPVREAFQKNFDQDLEVGASVAVFLEGEPVVDLWGGHLDEERTVPWQRDTITNVWSTTKTMTTPVRTDPRRPRRDRPPRTGLHLLARVQGQRQGAGRGPPPPLPHLRPRRLGGAHHHRGPLRLGEGDEPARRTGALVEPGTASGYHALTQGYLVGEVVRRVTGQSPRHLLRHRGRRPARCRLPHRPPPRRTTSERSPGDRPEIPAFDQALVQNPPAREDLHQSADLAPGRLGGGLAPGGDPGGQRTRATPAASVQCRPRFQPGEARGVRLLSETGCPGRSSRSSPTGGTKILGVPLRFGIGYGLGNEQLPIGPNACFWGGFGGSIVISDLDYRVTIVVRHEPDGNRPARRRPGLLLAAATALSVVGGAPG